MITTKLKFPISDYWWTIIILGILTIRLNAIYVEVEYIERTNPPITFASPIGFPQFVGVRVCVYCADCAPGEFGLPSWRVDDNPWYTIPAIPPACLYDCSDNIIYEYSDPLYLGGFLSVGHHTLHAGCKFQRNGNEITEGPSVDVTVLPFELRLISPVQNFEYYTDIPLHFTTLFNYIPEDYGFPVTYDYQMDSETPVGWYYESPNNQRYKRIIPLPMPTIGLHTFVSKIGLNGLWYNFGPNLSEVLSPIHNESYEQDVQCCIDNGRACNYDCSGLVDQAHACMDQLAPFEKKIKEYVPYTNCAWNVRSCYLGSDNVADDGSWDGEHGCVYDCYGFTGGSWMGPLPMRKAGWLIGSGEDFLVTVPGFNHNKWMLRLGTSAGNTLGIIDGNRTMCLDMFQTDPITVIEKPPHNAIFNYTDIINVETYIAYVDPSTPNLLECFLSTNLVNPVINSVCQVRSCLANMGTLPGGWHNLLCHAYIGIVLDNLHKIGSAESPTLFSSVDFLVHGPPVAEIVDPIAGSHFYVDENVVLNVTGNSSDPDYFPLVASFCTLDGEETNLTDIEGPYLFNFGQFIVGSYSITCRICDSMYCSEPVSVRFFVDERPTTSTTAGTGPTQPPYTTSPHCPICYPPDWWPPRPPKPTRPPPTTTTPAPPVTYPPSPCTDICVDAIKKQLEHNCSMDLLYLTFPQLQYYFGQIEQLLPLIYHHNPSSACCLGQGQCPPSESLELICRIERDNLVIETAIPNQPEFYCRTCKNRWCGLPAMIDESFMVPWKSCKSDTGAPEFQCSYYLELGTICNYRCVTQQINYTCPQCPTCPPDPTCPIEPSSSTSQSETTISTEPPTQETTESIPTQPPIETTTQTPTEPPTSTTEAPNLPPEVVITNPQNGAQFEQGSTIEINCQATDSDGYIAYVNLYLYDQYVAHDDEGPPFSFTLLNAEIGTYNFTCLAVDDDGASTTSEPVIVNVVMPMIIQQRIFCGINGIGVCVGAPAPPPICDPTGSLAVYLMANVVQFCAAHFPMPPMITHGDCLNEQMNVCLFMIDMTQIPDPIGLVNCIQTSVPMWNPPISPPDRVVVLNNPPFIWIEVGGLTHPPIPGGDVELCNSIYVLT